MGRDLPLESRPPLLSFSRDLPLKSRPPLLFFSRDLPLKSQPPLSRSQLGFMFQTSLSSKIQIRVEFLPSGTLLFNLPSFLMFIWTSLCSFEPLSYSFGPPRVHLNLPPFVHLDLPVFIWTSFDLILTVRISFEFILTVRTSSRAPAWTHQDHSGSPPLDLLP